MLDPLVHLLLPELREMIGENDRDGVKAAFEQFHPADVADCLEILDPGQSAIAFQTLDLAKKVEVFETLEEERQLELFSRIGLEGMARTIEEMSSDDRADIFKRLPARSAEALLPLLARAERQDVKRLLAYPEGTAGSIMSTEYASVEAEMTVAAAIEHLRKIAPRKETIYYTYVTALDRTLLGAVSLQDLILAAPEKKVKDVMKGDVISMKAEADREEVVRTFEKYDFLALPIVDASNHLLGIVTHDDVLDVVAEEATEDVHRMAAVQPLEEPYLRIGFVQLAWKRVVWLAILFFGGMFTGTALSHYEEFLAGAIALIFFLPLIISTGGNSGSQSATLVIRALAIGDVKLADWWRVARREIAVGVVLGGVLGAIGVGRALLLDTSSDIAIVVGITIVAIVIFGAVVGGLFPILLARFGVDPALASSPFIASLVDVAGIVIYLNVARWML